MIIVLELLYSFDISTNSIKMTKISKNYRPTEKEKFMNAKMKKYFHLKLLDWKNELLKESSQTLANLQK